MFRSVSLHRVWHAWLLGSILVAWATADEDFYSAHFISGWSALIAIVLRIIIGLRVSGQGPWKLPFLKLGVPFGNVKALAVVGTCLIVTLVMSGATGVLADTIPAMEDPHEAASEAALAVIGAHVLLVFWIFGLRKVVERLGKASA
jgi:hypothetical protein